SQEPSIDDPATKRIRASLERLLEAHDPYPGVVLDRRWDVVLFNKAAAAMVATIPEHLLRPTMNIFRVSLHPQGLAAITLNFDEWATYMILQLRRLVVTSGDEGLVELEQEVLAYPNSAAPVPPPTHHSADT